MPRPKIEYNVGDVIGGHKYVREAEPKIINGRKLRQVVVACRFCGREFIARADHLRAGLVYSCGCKYRYSGRRVIVNDKSSE